MGRSRKPKQPKQPKYDLVNRDTDEGKEAYKLLAAMVKEHHQHLKNARIVLAWMVGQKKDRDGRLTLGKMKKASELDRQLHDFDLVVMLNREMWRVFNEKHRAALMDHELCHADESLDKNGETQEDAHGKKLYRLRKHDLEEFNAVVHRHGLWKADLDAFAAACEVAKQKNLFVREEPASGKSVRRPLPSPRPTAPGPRALA